MKQEEKPRNPVAQQSPQDVFDSRGQRAEAMFGRIGDDRRSVVGELTDGSNDYGRDRRALAPRPREVDIEEFGVRNEENRSMAAHPLFRGLLLELPSRTEPPTKEWLDQWSSTARSILELLYSRDSTV